MDICNMVYQGNSLTGNIGHFHVLLYQFVGVRELPELGLFERAEPGPRGVQEQEGGPRRPAGGSRRETSEDVGMNLSVLGVRYLLVFQG